MSPVLYDETFPMLITVPKTDHKGISFSDFFLTIGNKFLQNKRFGMTVNH